jgi:aspartate kinase
MRVHSIDGADNGVHADRNPRKPGPIRRLAPGRFASKDFMGARNAPQGIFAAIAVPVLYCDRLPVKVMSDSLIVQKYGGSSLSSPRLIKLVAEKIAARARADNRIIVTVSAMGSTTDSLIALAQEITPHPSRRELDMLLSVGERISMALLSMALNSIGCRAISFTGSQSGIVTSVGHTRALIEEIRAGRIEEAIAGGHVVIVAGFQGVSRGKEITTLGRGGSDTTAVALAARFGAARCEIYSDVAGVFTADPRIVPKARRIPRITNDEMLELSARGAKVLHYRAAELARRYGVQLHLLSTFDESGGTVVAEGRDMEHESVRSVTSQKNVSIIRINTAGGGSVLSGFLRRAVEMDVRLASYQRFSEGGAELITLVVDADNVSGARAILEDLAAPASSWRVEDGLSSVTIVGCGLSCGSASLDRVERVLDEEGIPIRHVSTSPLSITCLVPVPLAERAVSVLHEALLET